MESCKLIFLFVIVIFTIAKAENGANFIIYGGTPAKEGQFPYQSLLKEKDRFICGAIGSLCLLIV